MTNIESLPQEVLEFILSLVSPYGELKACALTCHRWNICTKNVIKKRQADFIRSVQEMKMDWSACTNATTTVINDNQNNLNGSHDQSTEKPKALTVGKRYSHSAVYDDSTDSMYIFGGCTSTATTFNDLWRLDLTTRRWHRPMATGTYPSPKACSVLVKYRKKLILFGGWTHPSMYPLHRWRLFNELHSYDLETSTWTQLTPAPGARENMEDDALRPPTMAGHSATIHRGKLIVFGGLQKQRNSIGQFSSSSDVWSFDLESMSWMQEDIPEPRPTPRYGQSQLYLDETHLLILGGCGGPSNIFNDVWLLTMGQPVHSLPGGTVHWKWSRCRVDNTVHGASHMWCHPAVKVGNFAVILGKNRLPKQNNKVNQMQEANSKQASRNRVQPSSSSNQHEQARWNVIPQLRRGVNRGYGAIRRAHPSSIRRASQQEEMDNDSTSFSELRDNASALNHNASVEPMAVSDEHAELSVIPIDELESRKNKVSESPSASESIVYRSQITMNINCDITESECKVDNEQSKSISEDKQSVETMETSQEIESLHTNTSQQNSKAARENQPSHAISYSTTTPNTIPENTFASARSISSESISPEKLVISVDNSTSMNNQAMALQKSNPSLNQNSFKKSNEEHEHQPNTSNSKSQTYSAQTSNVTPSSRSPKVSAISFNKNAAGQLGAVPRLQAFAVSSTQSNSTLASNLPNNAKSRQMETRQRQLDMLKRMEERYRNITSTDKQKQSSNNPRNQSLASIERPVQQRDDKDMNESVSEGSEEEIVNSKTNSASNPGNIENTSCACQRLTIHVLDISKAISDNVVTWKDVRTNSSLNAPEETILYSLVKGKSELVMFGGIQKDVSSISRGGANGASSDGDTVSNAVYFLNPPNNVV